MQNPANDNALTSVAARPAEFDRQLAAAYPRLLARARRFTTDPDALVNQAVVDALHRWASFRQTPDNPYYGFFTWLCWVMMGIASNHTRAAKVRIVTVSADAMTNPPIRATNPAQEAHTDLGTLLAVLVPREREVLLRRAAGEMLSEIAADWGVTKQRVSQIEQEARTHVLAAANDNLRPAA